MLTSALGLFMAASVAALPPMLKPSATAGAYVEGESPAFTAPAAVSNLTWALYDWKREPVAAGVWPEEGPLTLPPQAKGYYYLQARNAGTAIRECTFCVVPDPATRQFPADSFFGVDAALSWVGSPSATVLNWYGEDSYAATLDLIRLCGVPHVRERMRWADVEPERGKFDWGRYARNVRAAEKRGLRLLGMFHDAAPYAGTDRKTPTDMRGVHDLCRAYGRMGGAVMSGWEFWNEPDIPSFWTDACWNYAAAMKAGSLGYRAANPSAPVLNGALCHHRRGGDDALLFRNDLAKYIDVFNVHVYGNPSDYPAYFADLEGFLTRSGADGCECWITESSSNLEGPAAEESLKPGCKAHSYVQELALAELYPKCRILMQMHGVARDYFFVFGAHSERGGSKDWGVQRRDGSVKPIFTSISAATEHLVAARLLGEKKVGDGIRLFVFVQPDGSQSVAYWSVSGLEVAKGNISDVSGEMRKCRDRRFALAVKDGTYAGSNWCGIPCRATSAAGKLELVAGRYVSYLDGLSGLAVDMPAKPRGRRLAYAPAADEDLTVVMRADVSREDFDLTDNKSVAELKTGRGSGRMTLHVWNLSDAAKTGRLAFGNVTVEGVPDELTLPAWGEARIDLRVALAADAGSSADMTVTGIFDGRKSTRLAVPLRDIDRFLDGCEIVAADADRAAYWARNDSAQKCRISWDEREKAVRFDLEWTDPKVDRWFYPVHMFKGEDRRRTLDGVTMLEFEARLEQDKVENDVGRANLMPLEPPGAKLGLRWVAWTPPSRQWQKVRIPLSTWDGKALCTGANGFRLGFNPRGAKVTYWIRNLSFIRPMK